MAELMADGSHRSARAFVATPVGVLAVLAAAGTVGAQVPTAAESLTASPIEVTGAPQDLDRLTSLYNVSDWNALQAAARAVVASVGASSSQNELTAVGDALDLDRHHVAVMWIGADAFGKVRLLRTVVSSSRREPDTLDLPGVGGSSRHGLTEVFLSRSPLGRITSQYTSTREDDPLLAQLPAFAQALAGPLFTTVGTIAGRIRRGAVSPAEAPSPPLWATVKRVGLPFRRASVRLQAAAREPVPSADFEDDAARLAAAMAFSRVPHEACARALAATLAHDLPAVAVRPVCTAPTSTALGCLAAFDEVLVHRFQAALASCEGGTPSKDARNALETVDEEFRKFIQSGTSVGADLDLTFKNRPPTHVSLGAGAAVMFAASLTRPRVDTKSGVLVADPLGRVTTLAFVNWSPAGYDDKSPRLRPAERFRPFLGAALTPDFGPAAGLNVLIVRGLGVAVGGAVLFGKGAEAADIGQPPSSPADPYALSIARTAFVGLTYNWK